jgi:iron complex transport system substrate-binding protein
VVRDALGREVRLPSAPKRVAALLGSFADVWALAGGEVCAAPSDAWEDFGLELPHAVNVGGAHSPSLELILSASPDLVLASASTASHVDMLDVLEAAGITVVFFEVDDFADYLAMLDTCTDLTGRKDLYEQNGLSVMAQIEEIKAAYAAEPLDEGERTVLLLRASSGSVKAKGSRGTILGEMLADMGCVNIADRDGTILDQLSIEAVIREEPRHIFVVAMGDHAAAEASLYRMLDENPAWGTLTALREGRLHVMDKTLFNLKPNDRWGEAYRILYETLVEN